MKVAFHTLGCKVNTYETEAVYGLFAEEGYERVKFDQVADVYVINTCTVTSASDAKSRKMIRQAIRKNSEAIIVAMGCYVQLSEETVLGIPGVDIIIGTQHRGDIIKLIKQYQAKRIPISAVTPLNQKTEFDPLSANEFENTRAFLKIQDGCDQYCSYCIIPFARGRMRSRPKNEVIAEVKKIVALGYAEIVLTGIHTGGYGKEWENYHFSDLIEDIIVEVPNLKRLRISSIEICEIDAKLLALMKNSTVIAHHLHLPLQSGSDTVLKRMNRRYNKQKYKETIEHIRNECPDIAITTDIIVGFPKESDLEHIETETFVKEMNFTDCHVFVYSKRQGTKAAEMSGHISGPVKTLRAASLRQIAEKSYDEYAKNMIGRPLKLIPEKEIKPNILEGHTENYLKIQMKADASLIGQMVTVVPNDYREHILIAQMVENS